MTQAEAVAIALAALSIGLGLWVLWMQRRMRAELDAAWGEIDALAAAWRERR